MPWDKLRAGIYNHEVMPSMRALMTAGPALARCHVAGYNCAALAVDKLKAFDEALYILMCGTGVGFSVERQFVSQLPPMPRYTHTGPTLVAEDNKQGWAAILRDTVQLLFEGYDPSWDLSHIRPEGARLKVFGGRASGPGPLRHLLEYVSTHDARRV